MASASPMSSAMPFPSLTPTATGRSQAEELHDVLWSLKDGALFTEGEGALCFFLSAAKVTRKGGLAWCFSSIAPRASTGFFRSRHHSHAHACSTQLEREECLHRLILDPPSIEEVAHLVTDMDHNGDDSINLDEFIVLEAAGDLHLDDGRSKLSDAFVVFHSDDDGKILGRGVARRAMVALGR
ncbi:hypothetical protein ZIOFF_002284 [Zingiber officinale]|uniref:Uncharacterized protein n=1 Tax=Zingiber officinale TaxID=94328 RepID=A0A8J5LVR9_ZINOF|nr:hypothetical protein ZIOFF_002284 [Zingiber officinale]